MNESTVLCSFLALAASGLFSVLRRPPGPLGVWLPVCAWMMLASLYRSGRTPGATSISEAAFVAGSALLVLYNLGRLLGPRAVPTEGQNTDAPRS